MRFMRGLGCRSAAKIVDVVVLVRVMLSYPALIVSD